MQALKLRSPFAKFHRESKGAEKGTAAFIREVIREGYFQDRSDRRKHIRYPLALTVRVVPLDGKSQPCGEELQCITRDISSGGAYLYSAKPITAPQARVTLQNKAGERCHVVLRILRQGPVGALYYCAGEFDIKEGDSSPHWMELVTSK